MSERDHFEVTAAQATVALAVSSATSVGAVRKINEDSVLAVPPVFVVADGMGGHSFGDRASQTAIAAVGGAFDAGRPADPHQVVDIVTSANEAVLGLTSWAGDRRTISGTTMTGIALVEIGDAPHWMAFNVGDSRVYSWDGSRVEQVSVDHSVVQEMVDAGLITAEEAEVHPDRNVITRALGVRGGIEPDIWLFPALAEQWFLVCSDGLTKELTDADIAEVLRNADPETAAQALVDAAVEAGGRDNVTVIVIESRLHGTVAEEDTLDRSGMPISLEDTRPRS